MNYSNASSVALSIGVFVAVAACKTEMSTATPNSSTTVSAGGGSDDSVEPQEPQPSDPDPLVNALSSALGFSVTVLATHPIDGKESRRLILFTATGDVVCAAKSRIEHDPGLCDADPQSDAIPWDRQEYFGLAIVDEAGSTDMVVVRHRMPERPDGVGSWKSELSYQDGMDAFENTDRANIRLEGISAEDVDGDGADEFVITLSSAQLYANGDDFTEAFDRRRLIILRSDLSRQFDAEISQSMLSMGDGGWVEPDIIATEFSFEADRSLVLRWCEIDHDIAEACPLAIVCGQPTAELSMLYSAETDSYAKRRKTELRPKVDELDPRCP